jgi:flagellar biosynthesis/type III secretory pathway chaperone
MKKLLSALEIQVKLLEELQQLLRRETDELSAVHLDTMAVINIEKEDLSSRIGAHLPNLHTSILEVATREGLSSRTVLGELAARLSKKGSQDVARFHAELHASAVQIKELLNLNREIAARFAASVGTTLDFLARMMNQASTYGASGSYQQRPAGAVFINKEA